jgi:hypothetical protein
MAIELINIGCQATTLRSMLAESHQITPKPPGPILCQPLTPKTLRQYCYLNLENASSTILQQLHEEVYSAQSANKIHNLFQTLKGYQLRGAQSNNTEVCWILY